MRFTARIMKYHFIMNAYHPRTYSNDKILSGVDFTLPVVLKWLIQKLGVCITRSKNDVTHANKSNSNNNVQTTNYLNM